MLLQVYLFLPLDFSKNISYVLIILKIKNNHWNLDILILKKCQNEQQFFSFLRMSNTLQKILSFQQRKEGVTYKETRIRLALDFPQKTKAKNALREK